ncbi:ParB/RepB/Spo0J family partition protein [Treponema socranskii]|uniref:ParB/RepB/Spo0J family partition protein n=1 Tax=Treponema socranskii TaxID=53419 RepID=UPI003D8CBA18
MALNLAHKSALAGLNSGCTTVARQMRLDEIQLSDEFSSLFPVKPTVLAQIVESIKKHGFDNSQLLHVWKEKGLLLDGHTRRLAALECGLTTVPVFEHSFATEEEAMEYALGLQTARRNLTDAELLNALSKLDPLKNRGRPDGKKTDEQPKGKSAAHLAKVLGTSTGKIEKARAVSKKATAKVKEAVKAGKMSVNAAYETVRETSPEKDTSTAESPSIKLDKIIFILSERKMYPAITALCSDLHIPQKVIESVLQNIPEKKRVLIQNLRIGDVHGTKKS